MMEEGVSVVLSDSLELLKKAGFKIDSAVENFVKQQEMKNQGIAQIWRCNCGWEYESPTPLTFIDHCGRPIKLIISP